MIDLIDIPIEEYHRQAPRWLSKTSLRDFAEHGPAWWYAAYISHDIERPRPGGALHGLALDCLLTEGPAAFERRFAVRPPDIDGRTKAGKEWAEEHAGAEILSAEDGAILAYAYQAVVGHPEFRDINYSCRAQKTIRGEAKALGFGLQARPDWIRVDGDTAVLYDLKKTRDLDRFGAQAIDLGYHLQAAVAGWILAQHGIQLEHAYLVAVEWERCARCRVYEIPHEALVAGDRDMRAIAGQIAVRLRDGDWSDHQPMISGRAIEPLPIPEWMRRRMEADQ